MSNQLKALLDNWYPQKDDHEWVLATVVKTQGSAYRKAGTMLLINDLGQYFGLVSGGCLESDLMLHAKTVMDSNKPKLIRYDSQSDESSEWRLGLGCGGVIDILLQNVNRATHYQQLDIVRQQMNSNSMTFMIVDTFGENNHRAFTELQQAAVFLESLIPSFDKTLSTYSKQLIEERYLFLPIEAPYRIAIFGGGYDAIPLTNMAKLLGWTVDLIDHRPSYARVSNFKQVDYLHHSPFDSLDNAEFLRHIDAAVVMGHQIDFDAEALKLLQQSSCQYLGLLGPSHRKSKVIARSGLPRLRTPISGPIGLNLGGELPESIALSILAEIHAFLEGRNGLSLSDCLPLNTQIRSGAA